jgi:hypothetical protein
MEQGFAIGQPPCKMLSGADPKASAQLVYPNTLLTHGLAPTFPPLPGCSSSQLCRSTHTMLRLTNLTAPTAPASRHLLPAIEQSTEWPPTAGSRSRRIANTSYSLSDVPVAKRPSPRTGSSNRGRENGADDRLETNKTFITVADMSFRGQQRTRETAGC